MSFLTPTLNLALHRFWDTKHGVHVIGTWFRESGSQWKPCLALLDARRPIREFEVVPCIIPLANAWMWAAHPGVGDPAHCLKALCEWMHKGFLPGNPASKADYLRLLDIINSRLPDLIDMPPRPAMARLGVADLIIKDPVSGQIIREQEITDHV